MTNSFEMINTFALVASFPVRGAVASLMRFTIYYYEIKLFTVSVMPKPVYLLTVQEAHKEYNSLTDKIRAKYEQLDSGKFGSTGTPAFDAEACELAHLLAHVSKLCINLNLPTPKELYRSMVFKH